MLLSQKRTTADNLKIIHNGTRLLIIGALHHEYYFFFKKDLYAPPFLGGLYTKMCIQCHNLLQHRPIEPFNSIGFEMTTIQTK